jgi:hypothetical protein
MAHKVAGFPGPVAIASTPPADALAVYGGEDMDDRPYAVHVEYRVGRRRVVDVRTVRSSLDWTPAFETIEDLGTMMEEHGRGPGNAIPTTVTVDGLPVAGMRIDHPNISGLHLEWQGQNVFCIGERSAIDTLELKTGTPDDFTAFAAAIAVFRNERRAASD